MQLRKINEWVRSHQQVLLEGGLPSREAQAAADSIGVTRQDFYNALSLLSTLLFTQKPEDFATQPSIEFYAAQLKEISLGDKIEKAQLLFKGIQLSPDEIEYTRQKSFVTQYLMPILEDLQVTCDLRAIFRSLPSGSTTSEDHENRLQTLLGFTPIAIVSLELNDAAGNEDVSTFQLTESDLKFVIKIFQEALT